MNRSHVSWSAQVTAVPSSGAEASEENTSSEERDCPADNLETREGGIQTFTQGDKSNRQVSQNEPS